MNLSPLNSATINHLYDDDGVRDPWEEYWDYMFS